MWNINGIDPGDDDAQLVQAARKSPTAFAELYQRHHVRIYRYCLLKVGDVREAQELTSQTFVAALEGIDRYHHQGKFIAWLLSIARHKSADYFRQKHDHMALDEVLDLSNPAPLPEEIVIANIRWEQLQQALNSLSPDRSAAIEYRLIVGLSVAETAEVMHKSEVAVRQLVHRAIQDLRQRLNLALEFEK
jgi:RNA polymerase sigma-70 factor, ECF subfamily